MVYLKMHNTSGPVNRKNILEIFPDFKIKAKDATDAVKIIIDFTYEKVKIKTEDLKASDILFNFSKFEDAFSTFFVYYSEITQNWDLSGNKLFQSPIGIQKRFLKENEIYIRMLLEEEGIL